MAVDEGFTGAWLKWQWGVLHAVRLQKEMNAWALDPDNQPFFKVQAHYHAKRHGFALVVEAMRPVPIEFGLMVGDIAHNQRSALDHVAWELVRRGNRPPHALSNRQRQRIAFPIFSGPPGGGFHATVLNKQLPGVGRRQRTLIRGLQPYVHRKANESRQPLALLARIDNDDKHRTIQPVAAVSSSATYEVTQLRGCEVTRVTGRSRSQMLEDGAELEFVGARKLGRDAEPHMEVHSSVPSIPTIGDRLTVDDFLNRIGPAVGAILKQFSDAPPEVMARWPAELIPDGYVVTPEGIVRA